MDIDTLNEYIDTTCEIKTMSNDLLVLAKVYEVMDTLTPSIEIVSRNDDPLTTLHYGFPVKVCLHNKDELLILGGRVYLSNEKFWRISNLTELQNFERRGLFRVPALMRCQVRLYQELPKLPAQEGEETKEPEGYPAKMVDISLSGVKFVSEQLFDEASTLELFDIMMPDDPVAFSLACEIVRREESQSAGFIYRCKFRKMPQRESDRLCKAIFTLQRNSIRKQIS